MLPSRLGRAAVAGTLGFATLVAVIFTAGGGPRMPLLILGTFWAVLGIVGAIFSAVDVVPDSVTRVLSNVGLGPRQGWSDVESMVARGHYDAAAETCRLRAGRPGEQVDATLRLAAILTDHLNRAGEARAALQDLLRSPRLAPGDRRRVRGALALMEPVPDGTGENSPPGPS